MQSAEWILTFDDGPLPSDVVSWSDAAVNELLDPLRAIITTLASHPAGPIPAVFFLRGPAYPWQPQPPVEVFREGVALIRQAGHAAGLHCYSHEPLQWWDWLVHSAEIPADLDQCAAYFGAMPPEPITIFRPPYGQGGPPGVEWAARHGIRWRRWDIDTEDWLRHPDVSPLLRRFVNNPAGHLEHVLNSLPLKMSWDALWPGANDFLMHVSVRTAAHLPQIVDRICQVTRDRNREPRFVVPAEYLQR